MITKTRLLTITCVVFFVVLGIAATSMPHKKPRNLKVLPKDITDEKLDSIMHTYNKALGVNCGFCHTPHHKNFPDSLNYAIDENPMKEDARKMMRLTIQINKDFFYYDTAQRPEYLKVVTCITCHRGEAFPEH
jgi:Photosynthetic reaction centre cytochrome C subunit